MVTIDEFVARVADEVGRAGEANVHLSWSSGRFVQGIGLPVDRKYELDGISAGDKGNYASASEAAKDALNDGTENLEYWLGKRGKFDVVSVTGVKNDALVVVTGIPDVQDNEVPRVPEKIARFLADARPLCPTDLSGNAGAKERVLLRHFPHWFTKKQDISDYSDAQIGVIFKRFVDTYSRKYGI